ncbi:hypothetical protein A4308_12370 [Enterobacter sp. ODB01]|uniref:hypothetical protein n=2 Tax=Enterobacter TaxID=547 RepID=UPI0007AE13AD|nr:hypothetical protein A4308_12370 [Enterobacter sp. ODB01]VAL43465.1 RHS repeat-associated core domain [Enterobacter kobei]
MLITGVAEVNDWRPSSPGKKLGDGKVSTLPSGCDITLLKLIFSLSVRASNKQSEVRIDDKQAPQIGSEAGFNGERRDPVLGGYHPGNGSRVYNPALYRFPSLDSTCPFGEEGINP